MALLPVPDALARVLAHAHTLHPDVSRVERANEALFAQDSLLECVEAPWSEHLLACMEGASNRDALAHCQPERNVAATVGRRRRFASFTFP